MPWIDPGYARLRALQILHFGLVSFGLWTQGGDRHPQVAWAQQVIPDGSLNSVVNSSNGRDFVVTGGGAAGSNLFHSFQEFSLPLGGSARFDPAPSVQTIFARVTGPWASQIDGRLITNPGVSLFLLNPQGIVFGPNASLDVGGSFVASTGDRIQFADGLEFVASRPEPALLSVSLPVGIQFGAQAAAIEQRGMLQVAPGHTLGLLGGDIRLEGGRAIAPGGSLQVGAVAAGSAVGLVPLPQGWSFGYGATLGFRDITLQAAASLDATGLAGGPVQVQGRRVSLQTGSTINSGTLGAISGAPVTVRGSEAISLEQTFTPNPLVGGITTFGSDTASGNAGDIHIATPNLSLVDGLIGTGHVGLGANGNVWVNAGQIFVRNQSLGPIPLASIAGIFSTTLGREAVSGGNLQVTSDQITLLDGGMISTGTFGRGDSGNIQITANRLDVIGGFAPQRLSSGVSTEVLVGSAQGNGGDIEINASQIRLLNGGTITSATSGQGDAGNIRIQAQSLEIAGQLPFLDFRNQIAFSQISASADPPPMLLTPPPAASLNQPPLFSLLPIGPTTNGAAGSLDLNADKITLRDGGRIVVNHLSDSTNPANIYLTANTLVLRNGSSISTDSRGNAVGGNIDLTTQFLVAVGNSDITANATNNFGGRVTVRAKSVLGTAVRPFLTPESDITASSSLGADFAGSVQLTTLGLDPSQGTTPLTADLLDPNQQVSDRCGTVQSGEFVVTGRGGVPSTPMSPGDRPWQDLRAPAAIATAPPSLTAQSPTSSLQEAGLWTLDAQGQIELIANRGSRDPGNASCLTRVTSGSSNTRLQSLQSKNHSPVGLGR